MNRKVTGKAQGSQIDAAEEWLKNNDPDYSSRKRGWISPTTDALSRALSEKNLRHDSLRDVNETAPQGAGLYNKRRHLYGDDGVDESAFDFDVDVERLPAAHDDEE